MRWLKSIGREILGLFVDDGSFAGAIVVWLILAVAVLPRVAPDAGWSGPTLFAGLALVLVESVLRYARRKRR
jgi:hypothetical protein